MLRRLSLTRRLTLFFTLVAASVVLGLGGLFMTAADRHFIELDRSVLQDKQHLIDDILANANSADDVRWRLSEALKHHHGLFVLVSNQAGNALFQTEGFPAPDRWLLPEHETLMHALSGGQQGQRQYRTQQFRTQAQYAPEAPLVITMAMDTTHHRHFLDDLLRTFEVYALAAILVSGLFGWAAVHCGLAPLRAIKAHAAAVTAQRLHACMPVQAVPVELADLAHTLNQMLERLQDDFRRLSEFASDLAHELRTPIAAIRAHAQVIERMIPKDSEAERLSLSDMLAACDRASRLIEQLLALARLESSEQAAASREICRVDRLVMHAARELAPRGLERDQVIEMHIDENQSIEDCVNPALIEALVRNLMDNAIRYTPIGGQVQLRMEGLSKSWLWHYQLANIC
ncbi:MAG: HAMP domain-containing protein [Oxalobacteraceae bacterium]|nr:HAMP domain-containing protein [Oxalobacteraceae bacterium]